MPFPKNFEELKKKIWDTAKELDQKYNVSHSLDRGAKAAVEGIRKGTEAAKVGLEKAREEFQKLDQTYDVSGKMRQAAQDLVEAAKKGSKAAEAKAEDWLGEAGQYYERFSQATGAAEKTVHLGAALRSNWEKARQWIRENPGKTALVGISVIVGTRAGQAFPQLEARILGIGGPGHWFFHSALAAYGLRKLSELYVAYLKEQERLMQAGKLTEVEAARLEFQRNVVKYVGAPLLGAFSVATGATLVAQSLSPGRIVGAPVEWVLGGNPLLSSIWLFSNGLICLHNGYKFFVMALADEDVIAQVAREVKYLLPASS